jgi:hypothetical protein
MLIFRINLNLLIIPSVLLLAISEDGLLENRLSFELPRRFLLSSPTEHVLLTGRNSLNFSTNNSMLNIHFRYSIHDNRLVIKDSNDNHELYKVICKPNTQCRILKDGMELFQVNGSALWRDLDEVVSQRRSIGIGYNWTISTLPVRKKISLLHAAYSAQ